MINYNIYYSNSIIIVYQLDVYLYNNCDFRYNVKCICYPLPLTYVCLFPDKYILVECEEERKRMCICLY